MARREKRRKHFGRSIDDKVISRKCVFIIRQTRTPAREGFVFENGPTFRSHSSVHLIISNSVFDIITHNRQMIIILLLLSATASPGFNNNNDNNFIRDNRAAFLFITRRKTISRTRLWFDFGGFFRVTRSVSCRYGGNYQQKNIILYRQKFNLRGSKKKKFKKSRSVYM